MLHQQNLYVQMFRSLNGSALREHAPTPFQILFHAGRHPSSEHI